jgi:hypothetical protein
MAQVFFGFLLVVLNWIVGFWIYDVSLLPRLLALMVEETGLIEARKPLPQGGRDEERNRLVNAYRLEMARIRQEPALIAEAPADDAAANPEPWTFAGFTLESFSDLEDILGLDPIHEADPDKGWPTARA